MAYIHLLNLYEKIDLRIKRTNILIKKEDLTPEELKFLEGRVAVLNEFRQFLSQSLDRKLPKRIRKRLSVTNK